MNKYLSSEVLSNARHYGRNNRNTEDRPLSQRAYTLSQVGNPGMKQIQSVSMATYIQVRFKLYTCKQGPWIERNALAREAFTKEGSAEEVFLRRGLKALGFSRQTGSWGEEQGVCKAWKQKSAEVQKTGCWKGRKIPPLMRKAVLLFTFQSAQSQA